MSDDFPPRGVNAGAGLGSLGSTIALYGAAPYDGIGGTGWPARIVPAPQQGPLLQPYLAPMPGAPETAEAVLARMKHRIAWLENELRMHEAWRTELATLQKMIAAYEAVK